MAKAAKRIESLTSSQVAELAVYRDRWLKVGLSTEPTDRPGAEAAVCEAYVAAGLQPPKIFIWLASPMAGAVGAAYLAALKLPRAQVRDQVRDQVWDQVMAQVRDQVMAQVRDQVWAQVMAQVGDQVRDQVRDQVGAQVRAQVRDQVGAQVGDQVWDQVGAQVGDQVWAQVRDQVGAQVRAQVRDQVWAQVWAQVRDQVGAQVGAQVWAQVGAQVGAQVWAQVRDQVGAQVRDQVWDQVWAQVRAQVRDQVWAQVRDQVRAQVRDQVGAQMYQAGYGLHDSEWLGFYDFFGGVCGLEAPLKLSGLMNIARTAGWWWPFQGAVILTERPVFLARDERNRLHCESRAAIEYSDGWGVYAWHGVRVPEQVIKAPETMTAKQIEAENNAEIRRVMVERFGANRYLKESGAVKVNEDGWGVLWRKDVPGDEPILMVELENSTAEPDGSVKKYMLRVDPECRPLLDGGLGEPQALTARNAVASTFGLRGEEYSPQWES